MGRARGGEEINMCFFKKSEKSYAEIVTEADTRYCEQEAELEAKRKECVSGFFADLNKLTAKARAKGEACIPDVVSSIEGSVRKEMTQRAGEGDGYIELPYEEYFKVAISRITSGEFDNSDYMLEEVCRRIMDIFDGQGFRVDANERGLIISWRN